MAVVVGEGTWWEIAAIVSRDGDRMGWHRDGREGLQELTEAIRPVEEAAATARLDCRKAFLNIMNKGEGGFREERVRVSERCGGRRRRKKKRGRREEEEE